MRQHALIFDFGNVIAFFDYDRACERLGGRLGVTGAVLRERLLDQGFHEILKLFECGLMAPHRFADEVTARAGLTLPYEEFVRDWTDIFWLNEPVARLTVLLKSGGYTLVLGSNTNSLHATHYRRQFAATLDQFDGFVLSHEVGCLKPDPGFYAACVVAAKLPAASCVFVDDVEENVEGARQAGLIALHYVNTPQLIADLRRVGVAVPPGEC